MTHVFVAPHPDDVALSCGGLIAGLRELGQNVAILTVFSGDGAAGRLTPYQREALGFGSKAIWPATEAFNRSSIRSDYPAHPDPDDTLPPWQATTDRLDATQSDADAAAKRFWQRSSWYRRAEIHNTPLAGEPLMDDQPNQGAVMTDELMDQAAAGELMATRRLEDERYALFAEAALVLLDLPDAVFRGYEGDDELLGRPRDDDAAPIELVRREIARLEPQKVYLPLGVGDHVDHQLIRRVGMAMLAERRAWVMPGPDWAGTVAFYEDFPYAAWSGFSPPGRPERRRPGRDPRGRLAVARARRHLGPGRAQGERDRALREPDRAAVRRRQADGRRGPTARPAGRRARRPPGRLLRALLDLRPGLIDPGRLRTPAGR